MEKPLNTLEMRVHDAEAMVDSILLDSPLPDPVRASEEIPDGDGSGKLPEGGEGKNLPEGGADEQPKETPAGKLVTPCSNGIFLLLLM